MERNEILATFQACSGIEDISECIAHLEQCDWNLNEAVSVALAANSSPPPVPPREVPRDLSAVQTLFPQFGAISEPSTSKTRTIHFEVRSGTTTKHVSLDETARLADFRQLASIRLGIPQKEVKFTGWPNPGIDHMTEDTDLKSLHLPLNVTLTVRTRGQLRNGATSPKFSNFGFRDYASVGSRVDHAVSCSAMKDLSELERLNEQFILEVTDKKTKKVYNLTFLGSKTFEELRLDALSLTGVPPSKQRWEGLASSHSLLTPNRTLGSLNLNIPVHKCAVSSRSEGKMITSPIDLTAEDDAMEIDEFEDADDLLFTTDLQTIPPLGPLMPEQAVEASSALVQFQSEFNRRYGKEAQVTPSFFLGPLDDAVQEAFGGSARNRRLLAIYLHHDKSIQSNVFCSQLLCAPSVVEYMMSHCVTWAWDVTLEYNKRMLLDMCKKLLGSGVSNTVKTVPRDGFPMLILAQGRGRSCEINSIIQGNTSLDELMVKLIKAVDDADHQKQDDVRMEEISEARERIKREQEKAYNESLKLDMEKQKKIDEEKAKLERQQLEAEKVEQEKIEKIEQLSQIIPSEPDANCGLPIARIRFRPPCGGDMVTRTFLASEKLQGLLNYVGSLGYLSEKYRVITSYPKRDVSSLDPKRSLKDHKLFPRETLIIEERIE